MLTSLVFAASKGKKKKEVKMEVKIQENFKEKVTYDDKSDKKQGLTFSSSSIFFETFLELTHRFF